MGNVMDGRWLVLPVCIKEEWREQAGYRTKCVACGLVPGVVVWGGVVEFVPADCVAPGGYGGVGLLV
ncbi:hypothetical protein, partial [Trueperella sp. LYQ141]|uniref:hypothetical protein n=1 Tax=Trueperella sp. LYQ141 TaxID=3391058 RepID=UPI00398312A5